MKPDISSGAKLGRIVRYAAVALGIASPLLALAGYAVLGTVGNLMASLDVGDGWVAWRELLVGEAGGPLVGLL